MRDQLLREDQVREINEELAKAMDDLTTIHQEDQKRVQGIARGNLEYIPIQTTQLLELRDVVQKQANMESTKLQTSN